MKLNAYHTLVLGVSFTRPVVSQMQPARFVDFAKLCLQHIGTAMLLSVVTLHTVNVEYTNDAQNCGVSLL